MRMIKIVWKPFCIFLSISILIGCSSTWTTQNTSRLHGYAKPLVSEEIGKAFSLLPDDSEVLKSAKEGVKLLNSGDFKTANKAFEKGLRSDPSNGQLHFLNAVAYHLRSGNGNAKMLEFAETGYQTALKFDKSNYWAAYLLGYSYFNQQKFLEAQNQFSYALMYDPQNAHILSALSISSYYANDLSMSNWAAKKAYKLDSSNPNILRNLIFSQAGIGDMVNAKNNLKQYNMMKKPLNDNGYVNKLTNTSLNKRISDWGNFHSVAENSNSVFGSSSEGDLLNLDGIKDDNYQPDIDGGDKEVSAANNQRPKSKASSNSSSKDSYQRSNANSSVTDTTPVEKIELPRMTLIDVVIIRVEESRSQAKGINLLDGLMTTLGGTLISYNRVRGGAAPVDSTFTYAPTLSLAGLQYNFNIFNDGVNHAEVLARPSLLAVENQESEFYSGSVLHVQLSSNTSDGSMVDVPIGVRLNVTPKFLDKDTVEVVVHAERAFLETVSAEVGFTAFSQSTKTTVDATAVLKLNETLVLSGLSENEKNHSKSGVPLLQDVPVVQYMFSRDEREEFKRSILILLTPREARYSDQNTNQAEISRYLEQKKKESTTYVNELRMKEKSISNIDSVLRHISTNEYYRQFRTGDLKLDNWENTVGKSLERSLRFLYY